jgi:hypothetical protein
MGATFSRPRLYIGNDSDAEAAKSLLSSAGFDVEVRQASSFQSIEYTLPVLFAFSNRFEGLDGIRVFIENASKLGRHGTPCG